MGVKNLNTILKGAANETGYGYYRIVIDGSNLLFSRLCSQVASLMKSRRISTWNSIGWDLLSQTRFIIENVVTDVISTINADVRKYKSSEVYLVFDGRSSPTYSLTDDMTFSDGVLIKDTPYSSLVFAEGCNSVTFNIKEQEQQQRLKSTDKSHIINTQLQRLEDDDVIDDETLAIASEVFLQSFYYQNIPNMVRLMRAVLPRLDESFKTTSYHGVLVTAIDEADLVIKNIVIGSILGIPKIPDNQYTIVISDDTDYAILFADNPKVHCRQLFRGAPVISSYKCFKRFFGSDATYDKIIRLSPLFGNDYTHHTTLIDAQSNSNDALRLFTAEPITGARKKIFNVFNTHYTQMPSQIESVDNMLYEWTINGDTRSGKTDMSNYFVQYIYSILIYRNIEKFNRCTIGAVDDVFTGMSSVLLNILNDCHGRIYTYDPSSPYVDWYKFAETVKDIIGGTSPQESPQESFTIESPEFTSMIRLYTDSPKDSLNDKTIRDIINEYCSLDTSQKSINGGVVDTQSQDPFTEAFEGFV